VPPAYARESQQQQQQQNLQQPRTHQQGSNGLDVVIYQYDVCPFCNKVKAFLDYHKIPYRTIEVNPLTRTELKQLDESIQPMVPTVIINGDIMQDPSDIMNRLEQEIPRQQSSVCFYICVYSLQAVYWLIVFNTTTSNDVRTIITWNATMLCLSVISIYLSLIQYVP